MRPGQAKKVDHEYIRLVAWIGQLFSAQANLTNEWIEGKMPSRLGWNRIGVQHEGELQGPVRDRPASPSASRQDSSASIECMSLPKDKLASYCQHGELTER